jgi:hypothetical protein
MPLGEAVQRLAGKIVLHDLALELDAVGAMSNHGFHPLKARLTDQCHPPICPAAGAHFNRLRILFHAAQHLSRPKGEFGAH